MKNKPSYGKSAAAGALMMFCALAAAVFGQEPVTRISIHDASVAFAFTPDSVSLDSISAFVIRVENRGRNVEEAIVTVIDSASGDTLENWYPLLPPESADSTVMFWNTMGAKAGFHTLKAVLSIPVDNNPADNEQKRSVKVVP